jgi:hypothetical protein
VILATMLVVYVWRLSYRIKVERTNEKTSYEKLGYAQLLCYQQLCQMIVEGLSFRYQDTDDGYIAFEAVGENKTVVSTFAFTGPEDMIHALYDKIEADLKKSQFSKLRPNEEH